MFRELFLYKRYILKNSIGELKYRYAGSVMGLFWNMLTPFFQILIYTIVFSNIMIAKLPGLKSTGAFAIYLCSGLLAWISFSEIITRGTSAFIENSTFLKKLPIPEHVFVAQIAVSSFLSSAIAYFVFSIFSYFQFGLNLVWVFVPLVLFFFLLFGFGLALIFSSINIFFRDTSQIINIFVALWMWLTPIVYVKEILPEDFRAIYKYNPAYPFIGGLQDLIVYNKIPEFGQWSAMITISVITVVVGYLVLSGLRKEIRDNL
ncbi:ABC transporter permease [Paenibacillus thiaminolyticus]|uniref:ABC transporter permease n=1 Tax=Paenibacillus thiaminolyticus TaxID=49283 RepID=UPI003D2C986D